jgi:shikimate dehydrogenase
MILSGHAKLACVIGWPVAHSRSPRLHGYWLEHHGIDAAYMPLAVAPADFRRAFRALVRLGFRGGNITLPHKKVALGLVDEADATSSRVGAVNTFTVRDDGSIFGANTDGFGFMTNVAQGAPAWHPASGPAVVLGAGGASLAIAMALADAGAPEIRIANRTRSRARALVRRLGGVARVFAWDRRAQALEGAALLVNTTSLGMIGQAPLALDLTALPRAAVVTDTVYDPLETELLVAAAARGNTVVDGLGMLLHQARPGFASWFGVEPEVTPALRAFVLADLTRPV